MADNSNGRPTPQELEQLDQTTLVKKLLDAINSSTELQSMVPDNVTQLLTTAISQVIQQQPQREDSPPLQEVNTPVTEERPTPSSDLHRHYLTPADNVESTIEVSGYSNDQRPLGIKFPAETRRKIISMRKVGIKCKDIAKDLGASVSGVQKVWERFLATGTIKDRRTSGNSYSGGPTPRHRKHSTKHEENANDDVVNVPSSATSLCVPGNLVTVQPPQSAVLIDTSETMEAPGATVEVIASSSTAGDTSAPPAKKKPKHSYREELLLRLVDDCPLAMIRSDVSMSTSPHLLNLNESIHKPLYMEYVLGHPFGKAPSPKPFEANLDESKVILTDPVNPLGKEVIAALGYSTKVYFNACCKPSPLFGSIDTNSIPYSTGPDHIANSMRDVLQIMINLCSDPVQGLELVPKGPGPVLQAQSKTSETVTTTFTPPNKLSEYWAQIYAYAGIFQCCENFLSPGPPSCPCLICHPFESFADSLDICDYSPVTSPAAHDHHLLTATTPSTINASQLLSTEPTPPVVIETSPEEIIISQDTTDTAVTEEVCITEPTSLDSIPLTDSTAVQVSTSDGIQYVAYNNTNHQSTLISVDSNTNSISPRRSTRKRQYISQEQ